MATYRQQFKGSATGRSDYTIRVYLTGAAWYLSSAMLILEEQHDKDSEGRARDGSARAQGLHSKHFAGFTRTEECMRRSIQHLTKAVPGKGQKQRQHHDAHLIPHVLRPMEEK